MLREKTKKLKWTKPFLASFGDISEMTMGACSNGSSNFNCETGNWAGNKCNFGNNAILVGCQSGNDALNSCNTGTDVKW